MKVLLLFLTLFSSLNAFARGERWLGRSPFGLLQGDAWTSRADGAYTLFYNPAILARHNAFSFTPLNLTISGPNALADQDRFTNVGSTPQEVSDALLDYPLHIGLNWSPGLKMAKFGLTAINNYRTNLVVLNENSPRLVVDHRHDKGFIAGIGLPMSGNYDSRTGGEHLALGASVKYIQRESIDQDYPLMSPTLLAALDAGDISDVMNALGVVHGSGWGVDFGLDYIKTSGSTTYGFGVSILDPYTIMHTKSNDNDYKVHDQPMEINFGSHYKLSFENIFDLTLSMDLRELNRQKKNDLSRTRLGLELGMPGLKFYGGFNAGYYSYGLTADLVLINLTLGFYDVELGDAYKQQKGSRFLIYLSLFDFKFDP